MRLTWGEHMIDKDNKTKLNTLNDLNKALFKLKPEITGIDQSMLAVAGSNLTILNEAIRADNTTLHDGMKRADVINALKPDLVKLVNTHPAKAYTYDSHGDKHFPGGPDGTKFTAGKSTVNPKLVNLIRPQLGRIRRDAKGANQTYYYTLDGIPECGGKDLTIQIDYNAREDSIGYHGYPDASVTVHSLSRSKGGSAISK